MRQPVTSLTLLLGAVLLNPAELRAREVAAPRDKPLEVRTSSGGTLRLAPGARADVERRGVRLAGGTALVSARKRLAGRRGENLVAGSLELGCRGTVLIATGAASTKVTCLEGAATVRLRGRRGQFGSLSAGSMLLVQNGSSTLPEIVEVDIARLVRSSRLTAGFAPLAAQSAIDKQIAKQQRAMDRGTLVASNVTVNGSGGSATIGGDSGAGTGSSNSTGSGDTGGSSSGGSSSSGGTSSAGAAASATTGSLAAASGCG